MTELYLQKILVSDWCPVIQTHVTLMKVEYLNHEWSENGEDKAEIYCKNITTNASLGN